MEALAQNAEDAEDVTEGLAAIEGGLSALEDNPANFDALKTLEGTYKTAETITVTITPGSDLDEEDAVGLVYSGSTGEEVKLVFSQPAKQPTAQQLALYDTTNMVVADIEFLVDDVAKDPSEPVLIKVKKPAGLSDNLVILHFTDETYTTYTTIHPTLFEGYLYFKVNSFSPFVFIDQLAGGAASSGKKTTTPTPAVPVIYDVVKTGDSFSFTAVIANANSRMSGAAVEVKLNERYVTTVTIGADGSGRGTIEAPGFGTGEVHFSARIIGASGPTVTRTMVVYTNGQVVPKG